MKYGDAPKIMGQVDVPIVEMLTYLYLPIKMADKRLICATHVPQRLAPIWDALFAIPIHEYADRYVYVTCKRLWNTKGGSVNRPGWHADGFGTDDINYIWYDTCPTEFCIQDFDLPSDDAASMLAMDEQARPENIVTYPAGQLIRLDSGVIHRVSPEPFEGMRTFLKISLSRHRFDLEGNSRNYLMKYDWTMRKRLADRNMEHEINDPIRSVG